MDDVKTGVIDFVSRRCRVARSRLKLQTRLVEDLGLDGDEAADFIEEFGSKFSVDLSAFDVSRYFGGEGVASPVLVHWLLSPVSHETRAVSICDLVASATARKWIDPSCTGK